MAAENSKPKSELEKLVVDTAEGDVDRILLEVLSGKVVLDKSTGKILPRPAFYNMSQRGRLIVLLLARHALRILALPGANAEATPEALAAEAQVGLKSVREYLSRLKSSGVVQKGNVGYELPVWSIFRAVEELKMGSSE